MFRWGGEYGVMVGEDKGDVGLSEMGGEVGVVDEEGWGGFKEKVENMEGEGEGVKWRWVRGWGEGGGEVNGEVSGGVWGEGSGEDVVGGGEMSYEKLRRVRGFGGGLREEEGGEEVEIEVK